MGKTKISLIKHTFFNNSSKKIAFSFKEEDFVLDRLKYEFSSLYQVLLSNKNHLGEEHLVMEYLYYLCNVLISYYEMDYVGSDLQQFKQFRKEIEAYYQHNSFHKNQIPTHHFPDFMREIGHTRFEDFFSSFTSISRLRHYVGRINTVRSQFCYSRGFANYTIFYLQKSSFSKVIQDFNKAVGNQYSFVEGINFLDKSREAITDLGILLFSLRFLIHLILLMKHIIESATCEELSTKKVLKQEMEKRGFTMASDLVWAVVGLLTTYNQFFHISQAAASVITIAFLTFDTLLFLAQWLFEASQYQERLQELQGQLHNSTPFERSIIQRQIDVLQDEWEAQCTYFAINILAANLIATSFAISLLCTGPLALAGLALLSLIGNALYNSAEEYKKYQKSAIAVRRELTNGKTLGDDHHRQLLEKLNGECGKNYEEFWKNLAFNVGGIAFIITAAAASWPVALGVTFIYMGYRLYDTYQKQQHPLENISQDIYRLLPQENPERTPLACN
ncbi:hypothetical protein OQJ18_08455 [Fluoribacter dumoffii]|uniref:hypothetical protein n=1 Tax=Fluoribacter dumoffii TaxID=463 RepID=UPI002243FAA1|nr:hypothetical protein [Fluoribacter dumoffii]MCW8417873.1 hypothetical protein [Fluoribacter dumoffii]MCW8454285.1 hypothetical protein [Fluoribacter dumoffii]MCW8461641.1 hypothetical protein [Fluoribacter dumoffii]MCW8481857.1 hypothetical protein [Fluoribacter dumoffii]